MTDAPTTWKDPDIGGVREMLARLLGVQPTTPTVEEQRSGYEAWGLTNDCPEGCAVASVQIGAVPADRLTPAGADASRAILYLHGGGYVIGSPASHRHLAARLAAGAGVTALAPHYRLAPEHPFPAAVDDAVAAYRWLLDQGHAAGGLIIAGDSAGGGLTMATAVAIRDAGLPLPAGLFCISPWADLSQTGAAYEAKAGSDPIVSRDGLNAMAAQYLAGADPRHPLASPIHADLSGLPPLLIHCGAEEVLMSDSCRLAEAAGLAGVHVRLELWPEMIHVWHFMHRDLAAGRRAIDLAAAWMRERLG